MNSRARLSRLQLPPWSVALVLLGVAILAYGLLANTLSFYWDDWAFAWITRTFGNPGLTRYFSTNRPFWGLIYKVTTPVLGQNPLLWQIFALFWRWMSAVALWWALRQLWPARPQQAAWTALLFLVYPGFGEQSIAITFGHMFLVMTIFLASLGATIAAIRRPERARTLTGLALAGSMINLFTLEYFFGLEFIRPLLIWLALDGRGLSIGRRALRTLRIWLPYLAVVAVYVFWRLAIFKFPTYQPEVLDQLAQGPNAGLLSLALTVLADLWKVTGQAWWLAFGLKFIPIFTGKTLALLVGLTIAVALGVAIFAAILRSGDPASASHGPKTWRWSLEAVLLGIAALFLGGIPFWVTGLGIGLVFPNDRFTVPLMLGTSLLLAGILNLLPTRALRVGLLGLAIGLAVSVQFQNANAHRLDTRDQRNFFWQLSWRAPYIQPGTIFLSAEYRFKYESDNSITAPLNWMYAPDNHTQQMSFMYYFINLRLGRALSGLEEGLPIHQDYLAAAFDGTTSKALVIYYNPPGCLRVVDPVYDAGAPEITQDVKSAMHLSKPTELIRSGPAVTTPFLTRFFAPEPAHGWCYYFEKAQLARQLGDWQEVASLGDKAFSINDYPNAADERVVFLEGYAHVGRWQEALRLTRESAQITPLMRPMLCATWERIARTTPSGTDQQAAVTAARSELSCSSLPPE